MLFYVKLCKKLWSKKKIVYWKENKESMIYKYFILPWKNIKLACLDFTVRFSVNKILFKMGKVERKDFEKVPKTLKPAIKAWKTSGLGGFSATTLKSN